MARAGGITNAVNVGIAVQADWENREFISHISLNVRRLFDFLVQFGTHFSFSPKRPVTVSFCLSAKPHHHCVLHLIGYPMSVGARWITPKAFQSLSFYSAPLKFNVFFRGYDEEQVGVSEWEAGCVGAQIGTARSSSGQCLGQPFSFCHMILCCNTAFQ